MRIQYVFKKTNQFTEIEKSQFVRLRSTIFPAPITETEFDKKYTQTQSGYSYHGLMIADEGIVGAYNAIPCPYNYFGKPVMFCLSV